MRQRENAVDKTFKNKSIAKKKAIFIHTNREDKNPITHAS